MGSCDILIFLYLAVWAVIFSLFLRRPNIFGASADAQCYATRDVDHKWSVWTSSPEIEADKVVNVGEEMRTWMQWQVVICLVAFLLKLQTQFNRSSLPLQAPMGIITYTFLAGWTIWGAIIRYSPAGAACSVNYLQAEGNLLDWFYGVSLFFYAPIIGFCCFCMFIFVCVRDSCR